MSKYDVIQSKLIDRSNRSLLSVENDFCDLCRYEDFFYKITPIREHNSNDIKGHYCDQCLIYKNNYQYVIRLDILKLAVKRLVIKHIPFRNLMDELLKVTKIINNRFSYIEIDYNLIDMSLRTLTKECDIDEDYCDLCRFVDVSYKISPIQKKDKNGIISLIDDKSHYCSSCVKLSDDSSSYKISLDILKLAVERKLESHINFRNLMDELLKITKIRNNKNKKRIKNQKYYLNRSKDKNYKQETKEKKAIFYEKNKMKISLKNQTYRNENKENLNKKQNIKKQDMKEKITCECGKILSKNSLYEHNKNSQFHKKYLLDKENITCQIITDNKDDNKDDKMTCGCGRVFRIHNLNRHLKSKYHIIFENRELINNKQISNKEANEINRKEKVSCACGCEFRKDNLNRHLKSKSHIEFENSN